MIETSKECPDCGTREEEWDPRLGGSLQAYLPKTRVCQGCRGLQEAYSASVDNHKEAHAEPYGIKVWLHKNKIQIPKG